MNGVDAVVLAGMISALLKLGFMPTLLNQVIFSLSHAKN
jgi:hypothetical protein